MQNLLIGVVYRAYVFHPVGLFLVGSQAILVLYRENHIASHHHLCQLGLTGILCLHIADHLTALYHCHTVAQIHYFPQLMGNNDDGLALVPQHLQIFHQLIHFLRGQNSSRISISTLRYSIFRISTCWHNPTEISWILAIGSI